MLPEVGAAAHWLRKLDDVAEPVIRPSLADTLGRRRHRVFGFGRVREVAPRRREAAVGGGKDDFIGSRFRVATYH